MSNNKRKNSKSSGYDNISSTQPKLDIQDANLTGLKANDGKIVFFKNTLLKHSKFFQDMNEMIGEDESCLSILDAKASKAKILEYMKSYLETIEDEEIFVPMDMSNYVYTKPINLTDAEIEFFKPISKCDLVDLLVAADFLQIAKLKDRISQYFAKICFGGEKFDLDLTDEIIDDENEDEKMKEIENHFSQNFIDFYH